MKNIYYPERLPSATSFIRVGCDRVDNPDLDLHSKMETLEIMAKTAQSLADAIHAHLAMQIEVTHHDDEATE